MTYDELRGNLIDYEQNHINKYNKNDKKKIVVFTPETTNIQEEVNEYQSEGMTLTNKGVKQMFRQRRRRPQQYLNNNELKKIMIATTIVENKDISNKFVLNVKGEII